MKIGYLGPPGSFSHEAALKFARTARFVKAADMVALSSFDLITAIEEGEIPRVVLPLENSIEGSVNWVFDLFFRNSFSFLIEAEVVWPIIHHLIGFGKISGVKTVYSHPQALAQCRKFLGKLRVGTKDTDSTSEAVRLVAEKKDPKIAAIGTKQAAKLYRARIIESDIQGSSNNQTRFIVLGNRERRRTGRDKTSFVFGTEDKPGALLRVLEVFDVLEVNMTMIFSRPSKKRLGEYIFFVDVEAHQNGEDLRVAFGKIKGRVSFLRILGSYPSA